MPLPEMGSWLLAHSLPQRVDWVQLGGALRRVDAEEQPNRQREPDRQQHRCQRHCCLEQASQCDQPGNACANRQTDQPTCFILLVEPRIRDPQVYTANRNPRLTRDSHRQRAVELLYVRM